MVKEVLVGVSGKCGDGGVRRQSVGFYRNPNPRNENLRGGVRMTRILRDGCSKQQNVTA